MAIIVTLDVMMSIRKISVTELASRVGITMANLSILKNGKAKAVRFETLSKICEVLCCQPDDILHYVPDGGEGSQLEVRNLAMRDIILKYVPQEKNE